MIEKRAVIPPAVDPGEAEQTGTRGTRLGSSCHVGLDSGAPGAGPLPGGRVDGRRDDSEHFAWLKYLLGQVRHAIVLM